MTVIHSSDLGWTAGQDISDEFAAVAKTLKPGDVFVFDHMYEISGRNIQLADKVTLAGGAPGAGFEIQDFDKHSDPLLDLGNANILLDLTVKHKPVPGSAEGYNGASIHAFGDDIQIINSSFEGKPKEFVRAGGDNLSVVDTVFDGSYYQMRWLGEATNFSVENSLFKNSEGDGIKTARAGGNPDGTINATISNSVFLNNSRDGIDTTAGFKDSTIIDSYFIGGFTGVDFKNIFDENNPPSSNLINQNILITGSEFINNANHIVLTTLDRLDNPLSEAEARQWMVQDIFVEDTVFLNTDEAYEAMFLLKGSKDIFASNVTLLGNIHPFKENDFRIFEDLPNNFDRNSNFNMTGETTGPAGKYRGDDYYESLAGPDWSSISYPTDGAPTPPAPVVDPVAEEPVDPDPVAEEPVEDPVAEEPIDDPVQDDASVTNPSALLEIFVAYTDTDETISKIGDGSKIDSGLTDGRPLTLYATASDNVAGIGSVRLSVDGFGSTIENVAPYALFGDTNGDFLGGKQLSGGTYTAKLIVYSGKNGSGDVLETVSFDFTVGDTASAPVEEPADPVVEAPAEELVDPDPVAEEPVEDPVAEEPVDPDPVAEEPVEDPVAEEPVEDPVQEDASVTNPSELLEIFVAYTDTDETISQIGDGSNIDSGLTDGRPLTLYATPGDNVAGIGSVRLTVDGFGSTIENVAPYALFGDTNGDFLGGKQLSGGTYTAELIVYSGKNGSGDVLETVSFDFTVGDTASAPVEEPADPVVEAPAEDPVDPDPVAEEPVQVIAPETDLAPDSIAQRPHSQLLDIKLFDTSTDKAVFDLRDGAKISSSDLSGLNVTLSAAAINSDAKIGSVKLEMNGMYSAMENVEPYALFGDKNGDFLGGTQLADGTHFATLTAYSGKNGKGDVLEQITLSFEVGDYDSVLINGSPSVVSSYSAIQDSGTATVSNGQNTITLEGSAWKSMNLFGTVTENTVLEFDFKSDAEGEIQGIGFITADGDLETMFFQLDGSQKLGIQDFNDTYETGSGFKSYTIPVGEYFTGSADQFVLINDDDADLGAVSAFNNISLIDFIL